VCSHLRCFTFPLVWYAHCAYNAKPMARKTKVRTEDDLAILGAMRGKFFYLLVSMVVLLVAYPYVGTDVAGRIFVSVLNFCVLGLATFAIQRSRRHLMIAAVLAVPTIIGQCLYLGTGAPYAIRIGTCGSLLYFIFILFHVLQYVLRGTFVTADKIYGAICAFMLFALMWTTGYMFVELAHPGSFAYDMVHTPEGRIDSYALLYFSITTLTTTGYGDIVPISTYARSLANLEQLVGVFYVAVLVARLASLYQRMPRASD
jgi:hypothetical protein